MKIAFITSEAFPFAKTGGLADVSYSLPKALSKKGHDVRVIMPRYYIVEKSLFGLKMAHAPLGVPLGFGEKWASIYKSYYIPEFPTYFIEHDVYFGRDGLYDNGFQSYPDNAERFAFFSRAALQVLKALDFEPDIIHCNDWQTGLVPLFIKTHYASDPFFSGTATIMTVHNVGYQGVFHKDNLIWTQIGWEIFTIDGLEYFDQINYLKGGLIFSDLVTTVSRKYAIEIQSEEYGYNLAPVFSKIRERLYGITNGVDFEKWNPATDTLIPARYRAHDLSGKWVCKQELQRMMSLPVNPDMPVMGAISRLTYQKGMDVLVDTLDSFLADNRCQFIILGSGEEWLINRYENLRKKFPEQVSLYWGYNEKLSHMIEAGCDIYIMPSRYEPCGLNQMYSMKYGTIPVVRATGGLDDTVENWDEKSKSGNGFKFYSLDRETLYQVLQNVLSKFEDKREWKALQKNAMEFNYSWSDAAAEYENLYTVLIKKRKWREDHG